jgi:hypothetical protein
MTFFVSVVFFVSFVLCPFGRLAAVFRKMQAAATSTS